MGKGGGGGRTFFSNVASLLNVHTTEYMYRVSISAHSAGAYTATLYLMVNVVKGMGVHPPPSPSVPSVQAFLKAITGTDFFNIMGYRTLFQLSTTLWAVLRIRIRDPGLGPF